MSIRIPTALTLEEIRAALFDIERELRGPVLLDMHGRRIHNLGAGAAASDAATLGQVQQEVAAMLSRTRELQTLHSELLQRDRVGAHPAAAIANTPAGNIAAVNVQAALNELDSEKVAKAGDTMTGALTLPNASPTLDSHAARKKYVDDQDALRLALTGGTMSGLVSWGTNHPIPALRMRVIHGKASGTDTDDHLYINYGASGKGVVIGDSATNNHPLTVHGQGTFSAPVRCGAPIAASFYPNTYTWAGDFSWFQPNWAVTYWNDQPSLIYLQNSGYEIKVAEAGRYRIDLGVGINLSASADCILRLGHYNSAGTALKWHYVKCQNLFGVASRVSGVISCMNPCSAGDFFTVVVLRGGAGAIDSIESNNEWCWFDINRVN